MDTDITGLSPAGTIARHRSAARRQAIVIALLLAAATSDPAAARCVSAVLAEQFAQAQRVYTATLESVERTHRFPPPDFDPETDAVTPYHGERFRVVLQVEREYRGEGVARPEFVIDDSISSAEGNGLELQRLRVGTRVLMFEPGWNSICTPSGVLDDLPEVAYPRVEGGLLDALERLQAADLPRK